MAQLLEDVRWSIRWLRRSPGFAVGATLVLALAVGATAAILSVAEAVLWTPLPYPEPERVTAVFERRLHEGDARVPASPADFYDWRASATSFEALAGFEAGAMSLVGGGDPERVRSVAASAGLLDVVGVEPLHGRGFRLAEEDPGESRVVLLTHALWTRRFAGDPSVVGRAVTLDGEPTTVVGVLPERFWLAQETDVVVPLALSPDDRALRALHFLTVMGRLRPGVGVAAAQAEMDTLAAQLAAQYPDSNEGHGVAVVPMRESAVGVVARPIGVLVGAVHLLLVVACANVAGLLVARETLRRREIAVRRALGADLLRIVRLRLTEIVVLAGVAVTVGLVAAAWGVEWLRAGLPRELAGLHGLDGLRLGPRAALVTAGSVLVVAAVFGVLPALGSRRASATAQLTTARTAGAGRGGLRLQRVLVAGEVAMATVLLVGAALLVGSWTRLLRVDPGFEPRSLLTLELALPASGYAEPGAAAAFFQRLEEAVRERPGVEAVGTTTAVPFSDADARLGFIMDGREAPPEVRQRVHPRLVTPTYLPTLGVPLLAGRGLGASDVAGRPDVVVVNETAARSFWPGESPLGQRLSFEFEEPRWLEVVGVVGDVHHRGLEEAPAPEAYLAHAQSYFGDAGTVGRAMTVVVRARAGSEAAVVAALREAVHREDPEQPISRIGSVQSLIDRSVALRRFVTLLLEAFAAATIALSIAGLYAALAVGVASRRREIAVRMAVGADAREVLRGILREGGALALAGLAVGAAAALASGRLLAAYLYGVEAADPATYAGAAAAVLVVSLLASLAPALRAARLDPMRVLREE